MLVRSAFGVALLVERRWRNGLTVWALLSKSEETEAVVAVCVLWWPCDGGRTGKVLLVAEVVEVVEAVDAAEAVGAVEVVVVAVLVVVVEVLVIVGVLPCCCLCAGLLLRGPRCVG